MPEALIEHFAFLEVSGGALVVHVLAAPSEREKQSRVEGDDEAQTGEEDEYQAG